MPSGGFRPSTTRARPDALDPLSKAHPGEVRPEPGWIQGPSRLPHSRGSSAWLHPAAASPLFAPMSRMDCEILHPRFGAESNRLENQVDRTEAYNFTFRVTNQYGGMRRGQHVTQSLRHVAIIPPEWSSPRRGKKPFVSPDKLGYVRRLRHTDRLHLLPQGAQG